MTNHGKRGLRNRAAFFILPELHRILDL